MTASPALDGLLAQRLVVCVGPGGVGKTTFAAAVAVEAAARGQRALVLTIDPARRLAGALGLDGLDDTVREVDVSSVAGTPGKGRAATGSLHAAMLDTSASYDALIGRIAPDGAARNRILGNRVYRAFSKTLARSHAYVAMERLHDVALGGDYDLVVLDTPPMRSALEILDAPRTLARFLDDRVVRFFLGRAPDPIALDEAAPRSLTGAAALRILGAIASRELVEEMVGFFNLFASMREGFSERAGHVDAMLRGDDTSFVLVGSVDPAHLDDARAMRDGLVERQLVPALVVLNRSYAAEPGTGATPVAAVDERAADCLRRLDPGAAAPGLSADKEDSRARERLAVLSVLESLRGTLSREAASAKRRAAEFERELPAGATAALLPEVEGDLTSLPALRSLVGLVDP